jgi:hypothetical protein
LAFKTMVKLGDKSLCAYPTFTPKVTFFKKILS